ncbi:MAG: TonB-dependent receptor [Telluria sp.]
MKITKNKLALLVGLAVTQIAAAQTEDQSGTALPTVTVVAGRTPQASYNPSTAVTATKVEAPLRDIPQTVNVVPQALLRDQAARSMEDAAKLVPGVGLSHGDGQRDQVTIRGFSAIADQFVDGLRDDTLYFRDLSNVEQVEIIKGPASVLYGRGSSGGLINRVTKKPGINKTELMLQGGRWGQKRGEFDIGRTGGDNGVAVRVTGAVERADSYRQGQFLEREALAPSLSFRAGAATTVLLQGEYLSDRRVTDFGIPAYRGRPVDVAPGTYYGAANARDFDFSQADVRALAAVVTHRFSDTLTLRNALRGYTYSLDRNNTLVGSVNEARLTASLNRSKVLRDEEGYSNQTELTQVLHLGGMEHKLLYGVEFGKQEKDQVFRTQNNIATVALFNPVSPVLPFTVTAAPATDNLGIMKVASAYLQDMLAITPQWKALAGLRYDRFEQQTRERRAGQSNLHRIDTAWSPRVGLVYQPGAAQSYYASVSRSFQPSAEAFPLAASNAQIEPEETTNKEIGGKFDFFGGRLSATASLFRLERTGIKSTDPATNRLVPIGVQQTDGLELTLGGELPQGWKLWGGYSYLDAKIVSSLAVDAGQRVQGKHATLTPRHSLNLWIGKRWGDRFDSGIGANYVDERFANPGNTVLLPGYTTIDAMLAYRLDKLTVQLNLRNLADRRYILSGHGSSPQLNMPGAPRSMQVTARYTF